MALFRQHTKQRLPGPGRQLWRHWKFGSRASLWQRAKQRLSGPSRQLWQHWKFGSRASIWQRARRFGTRTDIRRRHRPTQRFGTRTDVRWRHDRSSRHGARADIRRRHVRSSRLGARTDVRRQSWLAWERGGFAFRPQLWIERWCWGTSGRIAACAGFTRVTLFLPGPVAGTLPVRSI
jgi:hypothetical protein